MKTANQIHYKILWIVVVAVMGGLAQVSHADQKTFCRLYEDAHQLMHFQTADSNFFWCFGYLHGRDRAWQMDFLRRTFQGRKAEIHGYQSLKQDVLMRLLGLSSHGARIHSEMPPSQKYVWDTYASGVNAGMKEALSKGVWEFQKLNYEPEEWKAEHSISILLLQAFDQTSRTFRQEIKEFQWMQRYPEQAPKLTTVDDIPWDATVLKKGEYPASSALRSSNSFDPRSSNSFFDEEIGGSNSWIISHSRSMTGNAWLANDPHLLLRDPPFWYWVHGNSETHDVAGVSLPGVPVVVSGANRKVSWGLTNSYIDVGDVFFIQKNEAKIQSERPVVWFRLWKFQIPFFFKSIQHTPEGYPVLPLDEVPSEKLAVLRWTGHELHAGDLAMLPEIMKAANAAEMDQKLSKIGLPSWNYIFLDSQRGFGHRVIGRAFKKTKESGYGIESKSLKEIQATEILSSQEMPHLMNPKRGWIATANNRHWPQGSKFFGGRGYPAGFRAHRIEELLSKKIGHDARSLSEIQCDTQAVDATFMVPRLLKSLPERLPDWVREELQKWDFSTDATCRVCSIYRRWMDRFEEEVGLETAAVYHLLVEASADTQLKLKKTFDLAMKDLKAKDWMSLPLWGQIHRGPFLHLSEDSRLQDSESITAPGDEHSVNPGTSNWVEDHYEQKWGASQRLLVEMTSPPVMYNIFPGAIRRQMGLKREMSQSDSMWMRWYRCERDRMEFPINWKTVKTTEVQSP